MEFFSKLEARVNEVNSRLCIGIDPLFCEFAAETSSCVMDFCLELISETAHAAAAFKLNTAFFEARGTEGWQAMESISTKIRDQGIPLILDCKRGDIGTTAEAYAEAFFGGKLYSDSVTLNPLLGRESVAPFLRYDNKGVFILCKTSNPGSADLQSLLLGTGEPLFMEIAKLFCTPGSHVKLGLVVGATDPRSLKLIADQYPLFWILAPGLGAQGGDLSAAVSAGGSRTIFPISRGIYINRKFRANAEFLRDAINNA